MITTRIETTVQNDGELHLTKLPCRKGDRVEAVVLIHPHTPAMEGDNTKEEARKRFLARAKASTFCSNGVYPSRDQLHERY